jgi:hypothetical protein
VEQFPGESWRSDKALIAEFLTGDCCRPIAASQITGWLERSCAQLQVWPDAPAPRDSAVKSELACLRRREMAQADQSQAASAPIGGLFNAAITAQSTGERSPGKLGIGQQ